MQESQPSMQQVLAFLNLRRCLSLALAIGFSFQGLFQGHFNPQMHHMTLRPQEPWTVIVLSGVIAHAFHRCESLVRTLPVLSVRGSTWTLAYCTQQGREGSRWEIDRGWRGNRASPPPSHSPLQNPLSLSFMSRKTCAGLKRVGLILRAPDTSFTYAWSVPMQLFCHRLKPAL